MLAALLPKPDVAVQGGCPWDSTHAEALPQQTDPFGTGESAPGGSPVRDGIFLSCRDLQSSLPEARSKAGHGAQAQTPVAGQPGF